MNTSLNNDIAVITERFRDQVRLGKNTEEIKLTNSPPTWLVHEPAQSAVLPLHLTLELVGRALSFPYNGQQRKASIIGQMRIGPPLKRQSRW